MIKFTNMETKFFVYLILNFLSPTVPSPVSEQSNYKLELVQVLCRHGDRAVDLIETYPNDPYNASVYEPYGYGQLTKKGIRREYQIGKMLRERYGEFLSQIYRPTEVFAYSTDSDRTKMSLQAILAGLYSPTPEVSWNNDVNWTPVSIQYNPKKFDFLATIEQCPEYGRLFEEALASSEVQKKLHMYKDFLLKMAKISGLELSPTIAIVLYNSIESQTSLGLERPSWCTDDTFRTLKEIVTFGYDLQAYTDAMNKIGVGPTVKRFLRNINDSDLRNNTKKIYLYAAHDFNLASFLRAHNITTPRLISYGTSIILEKLRGNDDGQVYIRFILWTDIGKKLTVLKLKDCDEICPLSEYLKIVDPILPEDDGTKCLYENAYKNVENLISGPLSSRPINLRFLKFL